MDSIEDEYLKNNNESQWDELSTKEINRLVDELIKNINKQFKNEIKDDITRNEIMHYIRNNYGDYFNIDKVETIIDNDINKFKRDCYYWLFILVPKQNNKERIYITI